MPREQSLWNRETEIERLARELDPAAFVLDETRYLPPAAQHRAQEAARHNATQIVDSEWLCSHERHISAQTISLLIEACKAFQEDPNYSRDTFDITAVLDWLKEAETKFLDGTFAP